jgi:hypothetical protein
MVVWQFITLSVLIGTLLVYAGVIARRLGLADTRLHRIEEALSAQSRSVENVVDRAAEAKPEAVDGKEGRGGYLTLRDLRAQSEQGSWRGADSSGRGSSVAQTERREGERRRGERLSSRDRRSRPKVEAAPAVPVGGDSAAASLEVGAEATALSSEGLSVPTAEVVTEHPAATILESGDVRAAGREQLNAEVVSSVEAPSVEAPSGEAPSVATLSGESAHTSLEQAERSEEPLEKNSEPAPLRGTEAVSEHSAATILEGSDAPAIGVEQQNPPADRSDDEDSVDKEDRERALFLSAQRRRRRARLRL